MRITSAKSLEFTFLSRQVYFQSWKYLADESIALFTCILKNPWLRKSSMILFLNKKDIFDEKIQYFDLKDYFPAYRGRFCDSFEAKDFILDQFLNPGKRLR